MNNDVNLYVVLKELFAQKKHAEYIRHFVENQRDFQQSQALDGEQKIQILNWLAESFVQEKDVLQARRFFEYLMKVAPTDSRAYLGFINLLKNEKQWQELAQFCHLVQTQFSNLWQGYWWAGQAYKYLGEYDKADEYFVYLLNHFPQWHYGVQGLTESTSLRKDWRGVLTYSLQLQEKKPDMWQGYWWAGQAYKYLKQYDEAVKQFSVLHQKFPKLHQGLQGLTETAHNAQNWQKMIECSLQLQNKKPDMWQSYWWLGQAHKNLKQYDEAEAQFTLLKDKFPNNSKGQEGLEQLAKFKEAHPN